MARRAGRKRRQCNRQPNGQPSRRREDVGPIVTPEAIKQRAILAEVTVTKQMDTRDLTQNMRLGTALGVLRERRKITEPQYLAGAAFARLVEEWRATAGIRAPWQQPEPHLSVPFDHLPVDVQEKRLKEFEDVTKRLSDAVSALDKTRPRELVKAVIDNVVVDGWVENIEVFIARPIAVEALRAGLNALLDVFEVEEAA